MAIPIRFLTMFFVFLLLISGMTNVDAKESQVYIVYLGEKPHDDHVCIAESHFDILADVVGSKEEAKKLMVHNYKHSFSGFAALLTKDQAKKMEVVPGVLKVMSDTRHKFRNTESWNSLGQSYEVPNNLLHEAKMGDGIIVGVIDTGIYSADSKAFSDEGLGPIPSRWKGECKSMGNFDASKHCNKKVIGARVYMRGYLADQGLNDLEIGKKLTEINSSPLDDKLGHGTHVASTVAGSMVSNISYFGLDMGTFRGGAPRARLAMYKIHSAVDGSTSASDIISAIDDAVRDGVDIVQMSWGSYEPGVLPEIDKDDGIALASYHAVAHGVPVILAGGNDGPGAYTISNVAPWAITVAATSFGREFVTPITLGNNKTIMGRGLFIKKSVGPVELGYGKSLSGPKKTLHSISNAKETFNGKVGLLFFKDMENSEEAKMSTLPKEMAEIGGLALIISKPLMDDEIYTIYSDLFQGRFTFPVVEVDREGGNKILEYIWNCNKLGDKPIVSVGPTTVHTGKPLPPKVAAFSSRGPNALSPEVLKPDIAAPGSQILAAVPPNFFAANANGFALMSGTSMAAPHVSGIVALLRVLHPEWSPAAIKSALVTTALNEDSYPTPIFSQGSMSVRKLADPFDYGGGIVNPDSAARPGLIYDMNKDDYINYLCSKNYFILSVYNATREENSTYDPIKGTTICQNRMISLLDLNFPSITIPNLQKSVTITRTVTNVGPADSVYRAKVKSPPGTEVFVEPTELKFNSQIKKITFHVTVTAKQDMNTGYTFGSLTWYDGTHSVRSPLSVKTSFFPIDS